jgi:hypothetical protein
MPRSAACASPSPALRGAAIDRGHALAEGEQRDVVAEGARPLLGDGLLEELALDRVADREPVAGEVDRSGFLPAREAAPEAASPQGR